LKPEGNTAVISGVSRGIGRRLAGAFHQKGWRVIGIVRRRADDDDDLPCTEVVACDLASIETIESVLSARSPPVVDVLVNRAGDLGRNSMFLGYFDAFEFQKVLNVNLIAPALVVKSFLPALKASQMRKVVNVSAWNGSIAHNTGGLLAYRCSKAGLNQLTKTLAIETATLGVTVVAVNPGWVRTDMGGPDAPIAPEDGARRLYDFIANVSFDDSGKFLEVDGAPIAY